MSSELPKEGLGLPGLGLLNQRSLGLSDAQRFAQHGLSGLIDAVTSARQPEVRGLYYNTKTVHLDGYRFIECRFDNCTLVVTTLNFEIERCVIDPSCVIQYGNAVAKVIKLFNSRLPWSYDHFPSAFVPTRGLDGSVTISERT